MAERHVGDDLAGRVRLNRRKAVELVFNGHAIQAGELARETMQMARGLESPEEEFGALWGYLLLSNNSLHDDMPVIYEYRKRSRQGVSPGSLSWALNFMALGHLANGERKEAEELAREMETLAGQSRDSGAQANSDQMSRVMALWDGRLEEVTLSEIGGIAESQVASFLGRPQPKVQTRTLGLAYKVEAALRMSEDGDYDGVEKSLPSLMKEIHPVEHEIEPAQLGRLLRPPWELRTGSSATHFGTPPQSRHHLRERAPGVGGPANLPPDGRCRSHAG